MSVICFLELPLPWKHKDEACSQVPGGSLMSYSDPTGFFSMFLVTEHEGTKSVCSSGTPTIFDLPGLTWANLVVPH